MKPTVSRWRVLFALAAAAAASALAGCQTEGIDLAKAMTPLSSEMLAELEKKGMTKEAPIIVRIFKEEAELEVWKEDRAGRFALLKTYPICRWSGELGPKIKEGDRQAPEGFYTITPAQMNPNSNYYLSFNLGYPNAFDRANARTGSYLMVHGACSSAGCYSMTNEQIAEIYALGRESFFGGQTAFQVQAYPFRMTPLNLARHRNNPNMPFWRMLKKGYDHFEVTRLQPKVEVCAKRYVFNAEPPEGSTAPLNFSAAGRCPAYQINPDIAAAVAEKEQRDSRLMAEYAARRTPTAPIRTGRDGGMHPTFVAELNPQQVQDAKGNVRWVVDSAAAASINNNGFTSQSRAREPQPQPELTIVADVPMPRPSPLKRHTATASTGILSGSRQWVGGVTSLASVESKPSNADRPSQGFFGRVGSRVSRWIGLDKDEQKTRAVVQPRAVAAPRSVSRPAATAVPKPQPRPEAEEADVATKPAQTATITTGSVTLTPATQPIIAPRVPSLVPGAQPAISADSFDSRWAIRR